MGCGEMVWVVRGDPGIGLSGRLFRVMKRDMRELGIREAHGGDPNSLPHLSPPSFDGLTMSHNITATPQLTRHESELTDYTTDGEKGDVKHLDANRPDPILEEDETNVGLAAYNESKLQGEIVSLFACTHVSGVSANG